MQECDQRPCFIGLSLPIQHCVETEVLTLHPLERVFVGAGRSPCAQDALPPPSDEPSRCTYEPYLTLVSFYAGRRIT
ncbi:hypothetical protein OCQ_28580 [Mycobacterium paraintracellulare]|nr:hypothetical protein OCQ_28580 [Mycobacterium paraintracellulare]